MISIITSFLGSKLGGYIGWGLLAVAIVGFGWKFIQNVGLEHDLVDQQKIINDLNAQIDKKDVEIDRQRNNIVVLEGSLQKKDIEIGATNLQVRSCYDSLSDYIGNSDEIVNLFEVYGSEKKEKEGKTNAKAKKTTLNPDNLAESYNSLFVLPTESN